MMNKFLESTVNDDQSLPYGPKMILQMQEVTAGTGEDVINHNHNQYFYLSGRSHLNQLGLHHIHTKGR